jgi:ubiquinone/menaquinone biosynthesis C-methylase UbiE
MTSQHDKYAQDYDKSIFDYECYIADVLFGFSYEYIQEGENILDVGIGTGISSQLFHKAGLKIYGIDGSKAILDICRQKRIAQDLIEQDVLSVPWPYQNATFTHVVSCGLFHFIEKL